MHFEQVKNHSVVVESSPLPSAQAELQHHVHGTSDWSLPELFVIKEIYKEIGKNLDPNYAIRNMLHLLSEFLGLNRGRVFLFDHDSKCLKIRFSYGLTFEEVKRGTFLAGEGVTGRVFESGETAIIQDIDAEPNYLARTTSRAHLPKGTIAMFSLPIIVDGHIRGVLSVNRFRGIHRSLAQDLSTLKLVATQIEHILRIELLINAQVKQRTAALTIENKKLRLALERHTTHEDIIGDSPATQKALHQVIQVADTVATVLLLGESGTGKELFAHALHMASNRKQFPFIKVNCGAIPESLFESELFGHEKGAFTGAITAKTGLFQEADQGTIFLDEVGDLPLLMQVKLLRVLQEQRIQRIGSNKEIPINTRIVAATNRDLRSLIASGKFRLDLFYRLNVVPVQLPALRDRIEDIPALTHHFFHIANVKFHREIQISSDGMDALMSFSWPGNIRQLQNIVERLILLTSNACISGIEVHSMLQTEQPINATIANLSNPNLSVPTHKQISSDQREQIISALQNCHGNKSRAAQMLGLTLRQLNYRIQILGISTSNT